MNQPGATGLTFLAKSRWAEGFRREHALARAAVEAGIRTTFIEHPEHLRAAVRSRHVGRWSADAVAPARALRLGGGHPRTIRRSVIAPGHVHRVCEVLNLAMSRRVLSSTPDSDSCVVQLPWDWPLTKRHRSPMHVFDIADDWSAVFPAHRERVLRRYERIRLEADAVVIAAPALKQYFGSELVHFVPNATDAELVDAPPAATASPRNMVYVGSLSERTDLALLDDVLRLLPAWSLDLYGPCLYPGRDGRPSAGLGRFLTRHEGRARWHGPIPRHGLRSVLDRAVVGIGPNVVEASAGQDAMKLYDYAARGLPVVLTGRDPRSPTPPRLMLAADSRSFADAVAACEDFDEASARAQKEWARQHTWDVRFEHWRAAARV